jgi:hypothetical protein
MEKNLMTHFRRQYQRSYGRQLNLCLTNINDALQILTNHNENIEKLLLKNELSLFFDAGIDETENFDNATMGQLLDAIKILNTLYTRELFSADAQKQTKLLLQHYYDKIGNCCYINERQNKDAKNTDQNSQQTFCSSLLILLACREVFKDNKSKNGLVSHVNVETIMKNCLNLLN